MPKKKIQVILNSHQKDLGNSGDVVQVSPGYARNYLLPQRIAEPLTTHKINYLKHKAAQELLINQAKEKSALDTKAQLEAIHKFSTKRRVSDNNHIFGSINDKDMVEIIHDTTGIKLEKSQISIPTIKTIGVYDISVGLTSDINIHLKLHILPETI
uniref:Large ribosomal subunit protein bL9c n=1 Tax=Neoizziella asiatica TaxID=1077397 RepID=A0A1G4NX83_9FLOR|nr:Ribosomal protein L9 [Neoizziella asiatica]SCW23267.1 Ribosomal protein L9 [Neoizziella asiatica]